MTNKPGLYGPSPMTGRFYFVHRFNKAGAASSKTDVTEAVDNIVSHARGPLIDAIEDALSVAENTVTGFDPKLSPWCDLIEAIGSDWKRHSST